MYQAVGLYSPHLNTCSSLCLQYMVSLSFSQKPTQPTHSYNRGFKQLSAEFFHSHLSSKLRGECVINTHTKKKKI